MSFPRYAEYVESGVDWLGKIPKDWQVKPLKLVSQIDTGFAFPSEVFSDAGVPVIRITDIQGRSIELKDTKRVSADFANGLTSVRPDVIKGDILMAMTGATIGKVGYYMSEECAYINQRVCRFAPHAINSSYLWHILNSTYYKEHIALEASGGAQPNISDTQLLSFKFGLSPSITEQTQIARFLDHETAKIDALIAEQKRLIKLLQEKRQAVISHAVTKGLDPNVPMKDSGVEWLGEVPAHWVVTPIKYLVSTPVTDGPHETPQFLEAGVTFISAEAVSKGKIEFSKAKYISEEDHLRYSRKYKPRKFDIFMVKSGATTGVVAINESDDDFNIWSPLAVIRCNESANPYFVMHAMRSRSFQESVVLNWNFGTQQNIGMRVIENLVVALPPVGEQSDIALKLNQRIESFDVLEQDAVNMVGLLTERRSALISAAVTGKIDVRDWQPPADENAFDEEVQKAGLAASA
tara:strand:- start:22307 stop:23701 length:1395 start_codon:yes stop_codon:yes gene_type:complete